MLVQLDAPQPSLKLPENFINVGTDLRNLFNHKTHKNILAYRFEQLTPWAHHECIFGI